MLISIDYDGTWTNDPALWHTFALHAIESGHEVIMITQRAAGWREPLMDVFEEDLSLPIIFAAGAPKLVAALELGLDVDVWIDDNPRAMIERFEYTGPDQGGF